MSLGLVDLQAIRQALRTRLATVLTMATVDGNQADSPALPNITILPATTDYVVYFETSGDTGLTDVNLILHIDPGCSSTIDAQVALDGYLSVGTTRSIASAIFADRTLGGTVHDCVVLRADFDPNTMTATMPVQIIAKKGG